MKQRKIGNVQVGAIGLGGMPMSIEGRPDRARSIATIHAALDAGITLIDTADAYHIGADEVGHNESLIAQALASYNGDKAVGRVRGVVLASVFGSGDNSLSSSRESGSAPSNASGGMGSAESSSVVVAARPRPSSLIHCSPSRLFGGWLKCSTRWSMNVRTLAGRCRRLGYAILISTCGRR